MTLVLATLSTLNLWWALVSTPSSAGIRVGVINRPLPLVTKGELQGQQEQNSMAENIYTASTTILEIYALLGL